MCGIIVIIVLGIRVAPFDGYAGSWSDPIPVDAIPNLGENQQIVFTRWDGHSPQDIHDQITYPLSTALLGIARIKSVRTSALFGFSSIYLIFEDDVDIYWARSRILEKLNSLPANTLPEGVQPQLGPDANGLGQIFWYTLEGRDSLGRSTGAWSLDEIRRVQDYTVKYALAASDGVAEVASIGGFVREYHIEVDPARLQAGQITYQQLAQAVMAGNRDVGAQTIEVNRAEYVIRGLAAIRSRRDIESIPVAYRNRSTLTVADVARVTEGPASRRGILDRDGDEQVGAVIVARDGANPMQVIQAVKAQIEKLQPELPKKRLADGRLSQLTIVPFYDRSILINETIATLETALNLEILISMIVILVLVWNLRSAILISALLPVSVLIVFIAMKLVGVDANIVALSGIAIAIGTMVDLGIILCENILRHAQNSSSSSPLERLKTATGEVSGAILTAVLTTIVSFIPVFALQASEGKLFTPLAYTKSFALVAALLVTLFILPTAARWLLRQPASLQQQRRSQRLLWAAAVIAFPFSIWSGLSLLAFSMARVLAGRNPRWKNLPNISVIIALSVLLGVYWEPLGAGHWVLSQVIFTVLLVGSVLTAFQQLIRFYPRILNASLRIARWMILIPVLMVIIAIFIWQGSPRLLGPLADSLGVRSSELFRLSERLFPGIGREFMPALDEGQFLLMPSSMPHSGVTENRRILRELDRRVLTLPEVDVVVGKMGRVESALDPAPLSMFENIIQIKSEYALDDSGARRLFAVNEQGEYKLKNGTFRSAEAIRAGRTPITDLVPDASGEPFRQWRPHIRNSDDMWREIAAISEMTGVVSAPKLQPIETRLLMLQTGMRSPLGIKIYGSDLGRIESAAMQLEALLKTLPQLKAETVFAERVVGKPYLHIEIDRRAAGRNGTSIETILRVIETALGGRIIGTSLEGRERVPIRIRYPREWRDHPEAIAAIQIPLMNGAYVRLGDVASIRYTVGPQMIKSENTFLVSYLLFDHRDGISPIDAVDAVRRAIDVARESGRYQPTADIRLEFAGTYAQQQRAESRLMVIIPLVLLVISLILYANFRSIALVLVIFNGIFIAFAGAFILIWLYQQPNFMDITVWGESLRERFNIDPIYLSVAVWVGFIALFGIATDDGVLMTTYLSQQYTHVRPQSVTDLKQLVIDAASRRIRPAAMTSATTIIALLPVLTSTGRGADVMIPMAIPIFGGMVAAVLTTIITPVLYYLIHRPKVVREAL